MRETNFLCGSYVENVKGCSHPHHDSEDLNKYIGHYDQERTHQGRLFQRRTPMEAFKEGKEIYAESI